MLLTDVSIKRPVLTTMMNLGLIVFGFIGLSRLPVRELPDVDPPIVNVVTVYAGASSSVMETQVTEIMEDALTSIEGIRTLTSQSRDQVSSITVEFDLSRDIDLAAQDVRDRVSRVRGRLPEEIEEPIVSKQDADAQPIMWVALYSDRFSTLELTTMAENLFKDRLQTVRGVSSILMGGAKRFAIRLWLDPARMAARRLTVADVERALRQQNVELPSGRIENLQRELSIETRGQLKTPEEYDNLVIAQQGTALVRLRDIGHAAIGVEDEHAQARYNAQPAMGLGIIKQSKANTIQVAKGIKAELASIRPTLPGGINISIPYDESVYIEHSIREVWETLGISFILVLLTIFVFLRSFRSTLIPAVAIPVSVITTFGCLYVLGYSVNIVTMLALVLAIGVVVDDAIVVVENIYRHIEAGMAPFEAAVLGMREIAFAVIATTVALIAVFLPMAFQTTVTGRIFIELAVTISFSVAMSSFVALTLSPMLSARVLRKSTVGSSSRVGRALEQGIDGVSARYAVWLRRALDRPLLVGVLLAASIAAALFFYSRLPREFLPDEDKGRLFCIAIAPEGATSEYTDRMVRKMEGIIQATPEVDGFFSAVALAREGIGRSNEGLAFIRLKDGKRRHVQDIVGGPHGLGARFFKEVEGAIAIPIVPKAINLGFGQTFQLVLQAQDLEQLNSFATTLSNELRTGGYLMNVRSTFEMSKPELRLTIDRDRAAALGVSIEEIARTLQILFGGLDLSRLNVGGKEYDVIVQLPRSARLTPEALEQLYVRSGSGQLVQLRSVVRSRIGGGPNAIAHYNRFRSATIEGTPVGVALGSAMQRVEAVLRKGMPEGLRYEWTGEARDLRTAGTDTVFVLLLAVLVIYITLAAQFESFVHPLTVMLTLPLAAIGALGGLWLLGLVNMLGTMLYGWSHYAPDAPAFVGLLSAVVPRIPSMGINLYSQIGMILLLGLVTKNGILLVDFANQQMREGKGAREAMLAAGAIRMRPILMTALTTIMGMIPIAIGFGAGAESRRPLGVAATAGMSVSTVLTLFVIPVMYVQFDRLSRRFVRTRRPVPTGRVEPSPVPVGRSGNGAG